MAITKVTNSLVATNAIQGTLIADNAITSVHIAQNQVTSVQIPDGSITSTQLAANSVDTAELVTGSIDTIHLSNNAVTSNKIATNSVVTETIAQNSITAVQIPDGSITDTQLGSGAFTMGNITTTGSIRGPASFTIDPAAVGDNTGTVVIAGDLQVDGNSTTINSSTLLVEDKNITLARSASTASAANTAGISVAGANADLTYFSTGDKWSFNKPLDVVSGTAGSTVATFEGTYSGSGNVKLASFERSGSAVAAAVTYTDATTDMEFGTTTGHSLSLTTGNTRKLTITNAGDVTIAGGIFTTIHDITTVNKFKTTNNNTRSIISMESKDSSGNAVDLRLHALGDGPRGEIYTFTNHPLAFATNNAAPQMTLDTGGRLGINQTPSTNNFTLQVKGIQTNGTDGRVAYFKGYGTATSIGTTGPTVVLQNANNTVNNYTKLSFESAGAGETVSINSHNRDHSNHYGDMAFNTRGSGGYSEKMRIMANGNVGINYSDPKAKLHVRAPQNDTIITANAFAAFDGTGGDGIIIGAINSSPFTAYIQSGYTPNIGTSHHYPLSLNPHGGNVGIGDNSPDNKLSIRAASTIGTVNGHIMLTGDSATIGQGPQIVFSESGVNSDFAGAYIGHARTGGNSVGDLVFGTRATSGDASTVPTERLRIFSTGLSTFTGPASQVNLGGGSTGSSALYVNSTSGHTGEMIQILKNGATRMHMANDGKLGIGTASPGAKLDVNGDLQASNIKNVGTYNKITSRSSERYLTISFPNATANQKIKIILSNTYWGELEVSLTGTYSNQNMAGILTKKFGTGLNANTVYTNESRITESLGATADNFHIGDIEWDSSLSKWVIVVTHRVSTGNQLGIRLKAFCESAADGTDQDSFYISSVYTTDSTSYGQQEKNPSFSAILTSGQVVTSTDTNIGFANEIFDNTGSHSSGVFTAPVPGIYSFGANFLLYPFTTGIVNVRYKKNSTAQTTVQHGASANSHTGVTLTHLLTLAKGDTVSIQISGSSLTGSTSVYGGQSYWHGHLIG